MAILLAGYDMMTETEDDRKEERVSISNGTFPSPSSQGRESGGRRNECSGHFERDSEHTSSFGTVGGGGTFSLAFNPSFNQVPHMLLPLAHFPRYFNPSSIGRYTVGFLDHSPFQSSNGDPYHYVPRLGYTCSPSFSSPELLLEEILHPLSR